jgi:hypothetical protein
MGAMRVLDLASDGRALLANDVSRADIALVDMNTPGERDLTWKDWSRPSTLSDDGKMLGLGVGGRTTADGKTFGHIRPTDGSPAVQLSEEGNPHAISLDGKWVLMGSPSARDIAVTPTGPGDTRHLDPGRVVRFQTQRRFLPDGQRIVFVGREANRPSRVFIQSLAAGPPEPLTPEGASGPMIVSSDSAWVIVNNEAERQLLTKYPTTGGSPIPVPGVLPGDEPHAWRSCRPMAASSSTAIRATHPSCSWQRD